MKLEVAGVAVVLTLTLVFAACGRDPVYRCDTDGDCAAGYACVEGVCAPRIGGVDAGNDQNVSGDGVSGEDTVGGDTGAGDTGAQDASRDTDGGGGDDLAEDAGPDDTGLDSGAEDTGTDSDIPCGDRPELCDGRDNNCNDRIDEDGACDGLDVGIRVVLSWDAPSADVDLHFLNSDGVYGSNANPDPNDCFWNNMNPEWGDPRSESDNPSHSEDIHQGSSDPEEVILKWPAAETYRILVSYPSESDPVGDVPVSATVKVFFDGVLVETFTAGPELLPDDGYYWNVACVDYEDNTVTALNEYTFKPEIPSAVACGGSCDNHCDCAQGHSCVEGECTIEETGELCCEREDCPLARDCDFADATPGLCGGVLNFDYDLDGDELETDVDVSGLFSEAGVLFHTDRENATVRTNFYNLYSPSGDNSCATKDNNSSGSPVYWLGNVTATFVLENSDGGYAQAATHSAGMYIGRTWSGGIAVEYFDTDGTLIETVYTDSSETDHVSWESETPIGSVNIRTAADSDFTFDDFAFGPLYIPAP